MFAAEREGRGLLGEGMRGGGEGRDKVVDFLLAKYLNLI